MVEYLPIDIGRCGICQYALLRIHPRLRSSLRQTQTGGVSGFQHSTFLSSPAQLICTRSTSSMIFRCQISQPFHSFPFSLCLNVQNWSWIIMTAFVQNIQDLLSDLGSYLGLLLGWYIYCKFICLWYWWSMTNKYIDEDIKYNPGHVIPSWLTSPIFAAPGLENYCQESSLIHETTVKIVL